MSSQTLAPTPNYDSSLRKLIEQHLEFADEPLLLAIRYYPSRNPGDVFLFEVIGNFGGGHIDECPELYEIEIGSTRAFPLPADNSLHLVMTSPEEFEVAAKEEWPLFKEVRDAVRNNRFDVLYPNTQLLDRLR